MKEKLAEKLRLKETESQPMHPVANPFAAESEWMPILHAETDAAQSTRALKLIGFRLFQLVCSLLISGLVAIAGGFSVQIGFDWGYKLVEKFFGQPTGSAQGVVSSESLMFIVMPLFFGFAFGCCNRAWLSVRRWSISSVVMALTAVGLLSCLGATSLLAIEASAVLPFTALALVFGIVGLGCGYQYLEILRRRIRLRAVLACGAASVGLLALVWSLCASDPNLIVEMTLYALILAAAGAWTATFTRARSQSGAILLAAVATFPILLANLLNILLNVVCLVLDSFCIGPNIGWQALLSAVFINVLALAAVYAGASIGFGMRQKALAQALETSKLLSLVTVKEPALRPESADGKLLEQ
jgi:hypothetical protein